MKGLNLLFVFVSFQRGWKSLTAVFMLPRRMSSMWEGLFFLCRQAMGGKIGYGTLEGEGDEEKEGKEFEVLLNWLHLRNYLLIYNIYLYILSFRMFMLRLLYIYH